MQTANCGAIDSFIAGPKLDEITGAKGGSVCSADSWCARLSARSPLAVRPGPEGSSRHGVQVRSSSGVRSRESMSADWTGPRIVPRAAAESSSSIVQRRASPNARVVGLGAIPTPVQRRAAQGEPTWCQRHGARCADMRQPTLRELRRRGSATR